MDYDREDYNSPQYKQWRYAVFARDQFKCQHPQCSTPQEKKLEAHHIERWADNPDRRFLVTNGITLCKHCHAAIFGKEHDYETLFKDLVQQKKLAMVAAGGGKVNLNRGIKKRRGKYRPMNPRNRYF